MPRSNGITQVVEAIPAGHKVTEQTLIRALDPAGELTHKQVRKRIYYAIRRGYVLRDVRQGEFLYWRTDE